MTGSFGLVELVGLALRRSLPAAFLVPYLVVLAVASTRGFEAPDFLTEELRDAHAAGALARRGVWSIFWILAAPICLFRAAGTLSAWRRRDADWLGALFVDGFAPIATAWFGTLLASAFLIGLTFAAAEWAGRAAGDHAPHRWMRDLDHPTGVLFPGDPPLSWTPADLTLSELPEGAAVRFRATVLPGAGPAVDVTVGVASSGEPEGGQDATARVFGPTALVVPAPVGGAGAAVLSVARGASGAVLYLPPRSVSLLVPAHPLQASAELGTRALLLLAAGSALALGLGTWLRPTLAAGTVAALVLAAWLWLSEATFVPGADLPAAWSRVGLGLVPPRVPLPTWLAAGLLVVLGLALGRLGTRGRGGVV